MSYKFHNVSATDHQGYTYYTKHKQKYNENTIVSATKTPNIGLKIYVNDFMHTCIS